MKEFERLKSFINSIIDMDDKMWLLFHKEIEVKYLRKNEKLLNEGEICNFIAFVDKGLLIYYKMTDNGEEITADFAFENDWVADNLSRFNHIPSYLNIKALEDSKIFFIKNEILEECYIRFPKLERLGRILSEQAFVKFVQLNLDFQILTATERYEKLLKTHPEIFQRVPLYHIANYLGIAPKSLSRIRNSAFK